MKRKEPAIATESKEHDPRTTAIRSYFEADREVRRGVCLLNAGRFDEAEACFARATRHGRTDGSIASFLAGCLLGKGKAIEAAEKFDENLEQNTEDVTARIRHALSLWKAGNADGAIKSLREGIRRQPEIAELHFQLGTLLSASNEYEEAELRFTQVLSIDQQHQQALISLALCRGAQQSPAEALTYLQRAQSQNPTDPRVGLLLAQAARAVEQQGQTISTHGTMPPELNVGTSPEIEELSKAIEADPEFVDALISIPSSDVDSRVFALLLTIIQAALERQPEQAELHFHCGQVLRRLGRDDEAIDATERAISINPRFARALIELAKQYHETDRNADAMSRLEQAIQVGAEFADVYYLLGNLYRDRGDLRQAVDAYEHALGINASYRAAREALDELPV